MMRDVTTDTEEGTSARKGWRRRGRKTGGGRGREGYNTYIPLHDIDIDILHHSTHLG
jgi:hypothetical protein